MTFRGVTDEWWSAWTRSAPSWSIPAGRSGQRWRSCLLVVDWRRVHREAMSRETHCEDTFEAARGQVVESREWEPSWWEPGLFIRP